MIFLLLAIVVVVVMVISLFMEKEELSREQFDERIKKLIEEEENR